MLLLCLGPVVFGMLLVLGDPEGNMVLATYLYKLTNKLGTPSYHLMAAVAVVLICITIPLVMLQRRLMRTANRLVTMQGKAPQARALPLGKWRWGACAGVVAWPAAPRGRPHPRTRPSLSPAPQTPLILGPPCGFSQGSTLKKTIRNVMNRLWVSQLAQTACVEPEKMM